MFFKRHNDASEANQSSISRRLARRLVLLAALTGAVAAPVAVTRLAGWSAAAVAQERKATDAELLTQAGEQFKAKQYEEAVSTLQQIAADKLDEQQKTSYSDLLAKPLPQVKNGHRPILTDPGLGITIDENKLMAQVGEPQEYRTRFDQDDGSVVDW